MKSWQVLIVSVIAIGMTVNLLASGSLVAMMNASIIGLGILGLYHLVKKLRKNKFKTKTVDLGTGKTFTLVPKSNLDV